MVQFDTLVLIGCGGVGLVGEFVRVVCTSLEFPKTFFAPSDFVLR